MIKKWLPRIVGIILIALVITVTRDYYYTYVVPYSRAKTEQELIWALKAQENKLREEQKVKEEAEKAASEAKKLEEERLQAEAKKEWEESLGTSAATGDDFFLNLSNNSLWESGEYDSESGEKIDNKRRRRHPNYISIECPEYNIVLSDGYSVVICEYDLNKSFIRSIVLENGGVYKASRLGEFYTISLKRNENEKTLSPGQWGRVFDNDFEIIICTDNWLDYSVSDVGNLIEKSNVDFERKQLSEWLLAGDDDALANALWKMQVANDVYTLTGEELNNGNLTYYVSSSEGDDNNTGLDIEHPKKTLDAFSGLSGVNVLLKCGDTFPTSKTIKVGSNSMFAAYGTGNRPIISYYKDLPISFSKCENEENIWVGDLSSLGISTENKNKENCNIGQLIVDGRVNWNRVVWSSKESFNPKSLYNEGNLVWAVDWTTSQLYIQTVNNPNESRIEFSLPLTGIAIDNANNVCIKGIEIQGAGKHGFNITDSKNVRIECCYVNHIGGSILVNAGVRYGNAFQVWNSGSDIVIKNNYASWIFDTCFTNQGSNAIYRNVIFENNVGAHFFWGIETWGSGIEGDGTTNVAYKNNILYDNVDVTNPSTPMHSGENTRLLGVQDKEYVSYRNGYKYHQMSSINVNNSGNGGIEISNNIAWGTNRFLVRAVDTKGEKLYAGLNNNLLYSDVISDKACLLQFTRDGKREYCGSMKYLNETNNLIVHNVGDLYSTEEHEKFLINMLINVGSTD